MKDKVRVGIVGSKFAADFHADSYSRYDRADVVAVAAIRIGAHQSGHEIAQASALLPVSRHQDDVEHHADQGDQDSRGERNDSRG